MQFMLNTFCSFLPIPIATYNSTLFLVSQKLCDLLYTCYMCAPPVPYLHSFVLTSCPCLHLSVKSVDSAPFSEALTLQNIIGLWCNPWMFLSLGEWPSSSFRLLLICNPTCLYACTSSCPTPSPRHSKVFSSARTGQEGLLCTYSSSGIFHS